MNSSRVLLWAGQVVLAIAVIGFVGRSVLANWGELSHLDVSLHLRPSWIVAAAITVWLTYGLLIEAWRRVLTGWGEQLHFAQATRIWCLSNLGRYLPGKIWSIAGLAVLAQRAGVAGWAAAGSAVVMQVLAIGTGAVVVAFGAPGAISAAVGEVGLNQEGSPILLAATAFVALATVAVLSWKPLSGALARAVRPTMELRPLPISTSAVAGSATLVAWAAYGIAFWFLAQGLFGPNDLGFLRAIGVFAAGYIVGLLALFAPGGVGVRELVFVALMSPVLGSRGALGLAIASRLLLTATEVSAALLTLGLKSRNKNEGVEPSG
jgi:hypothetical protein